MINMNIKGEHEVMYYDFNEPLRNLLYKTKNHTKYTMTKNGKRVGVFGVNESIRSLLEAHGYTFDKEEHLCYSALNKLYRINVDIVKKLGAHKKWDEIMIHVLGKDREDSSQNARIIMTLIYKQINVMPTAVTWTSRATCK